MKKGLSHQVSVENMHTGKVKKSYLMRKNRERERGLEFYWEKSEKRENERRESDKRY